MSGGMRDKQGNEMLEFDKYKKFAKTTLFLFTLVVVLIIFITGILLYFFITQFIQNGELEKLISNYTGQNIDLKQLQNLYINLK